MNWHTETLPFDLDQWIQDGLEQLAHYLRLAWEFREWEAQQ